MVNTRTLFILCLLIFCQITNIFKTYGQDTIFFKRKIFDVATQISISGNSVSYKKYSNPEGPTYISSVSEISKILYSSGDTSVFNLPISPSSATTADSLKTKWYKGKYFVYVTLSDILYGFATLQLERNFCKERLSIKIPISVGIITTGADAFDFMKPYTHQPETVYDQYGYFTPEKIYSLGFEIYYYPGSLKRINYFVGLAYGFGKYEYEIATYTFNPDIPYIYSTDIGSYQSFFFKNGVRAGITKHIYSNVFVGMGSDKFVVPQKYDFSETYKAIEWGIGLGVKF